MVGPKRLEKVVNSLRVIAPELPFEIRFQELSEAEESFMWEDLRVDAFRVNHNVTCYGYSLSLPRTGKFSVDRAREKRFQEILEWLAEGQHIRGGWTHIYS